MVKNLVVGMLCSIACVSCDLYGMEFMEIDSLKCLPHSDAFGYVHTDNIKDGSGQAIVDILHANPKDATRLHCMHMQLFVFEASLYNMAYNPLIISMEGNVGHDYYENMANEARAESLRLVPEYNELIDRLGIRVHMKDVIDCAIERNLIIEGHEDDVRRILIENPLEARYLQNLYGWLKYDDIRRLNVATMNQHRCDYLSVIIDGSNRTSSRYDEIIRQIGLDAHLRRVMD